MSKPPFEKKPADKKPMAPGKLFSIIAEEHTSGKHMPKPKKKAKPDAEE